MQYELQSFRWPGDLPIMESYQRICDAVRERASPPLRRRIAEAQKEFAARAQEENSRKSMQILAGNYWLAD